MYICTSSYVCGECRSPQAPEICIDSKYYSYCEKCQKQVVLKIYCAPDFIGDQEQILDQT
jgi:hypothetical protein